MRRRLFNLLTGISFLGLLAIGILWARSKRTETFAFCSSRGGVSLVSGQNFTQWQLVGFYEPHVITAPAFQHSTWPSTLSLLLDLDGVTPHNSLVQLHDFFPRGFSASTGTGSLDPRSYVFEVGRRWPADYTSYYFTAPHWAIAIVLSLLPALWLLRRILARRRSRAGICPACGYDLRATLDRCPECGRSTGPRERSTQVPASNG